MGDSREDLGVAAVVGRFFLVANGPDVSGPERDAHRVGLRRRLLRGRGAVPGGIIGRWTPGALAPSAPRGCASSRPRSGLRPATPSRPRSTRRRRPTPTTASGWRCSSWADRGGIAARERAFEGYVEAGPLRRGRAGGRVGVPPVPALGARVGRARLAGPRRARGRGRRVRGPGMGRDRAGAARREPGRAGGPLAPGHVDRARVGQRRPGDVRAQPAGADRGQRRAPRARDAAARGGHGGGVGGPGAQRAHAGRGLLQPDHGLDQRGRLGARLGVVRPGGRVRARAGRDAPVRRLSHDPRRRARGPGPLARGGARRSRPRSRPTPGTSRRWARPPWPAWPSCGCARAAWPRPSSC